MGSTTTAPVHAAWSCNLSLCLCNPRGICTGTPTCSRSVAKKACQWATACQSHHLKDQTNECIGCLAKIACLGLIAGLTKGDHDNSEDADDDESEGRPADVSDSSHFNILVSIARTFLLLLFLTAISFAGQRWQCKQSSPRPHPVGFQNHMHGLHRPVPWRHEPWVGTPSGGGKPGGG